MGVFGPTNDEVEEVKKRLSVIEEITNQIKTDYYEKSKEDYEKIKSLNNDSINNSNQIKAILQEIEAYNKKLTEEASKLNKNINDIETKKTFLDEKIIFLDSKITSITDLEIKFNDSNNNITNLRIEATNFLAEASELPTALENVKNNLNETESIFKNIKNTYSHIANKKNEIDDVYKNIYGEKIKNDDGTENNLEGIREKLEKSFDHISEKIAGLDETAKKQIESIDLSYKDEIDLKNLKFDELIEKSNSRYEIINNQLKGLLPGAMAEGLSHAYEKKKESEELKLSSHENHFKIAIILLILTSLIPIAADYYLLFIKEKDLLMVIKETPNLLLATLPIYFPILWYAYSTNKKSNLSKRLIEEYTHKSVLGKTFSGLSNQIDSIPNENNIKEELRVQLLFNLLQVSAENPGKLITDYNKADHPIFDVIQKSSQLSESLDSLAKIPGISVISKKISNRIDKNLEEANLKVENAIKALDSEVK